MKENTKAQVSWYHLAFENHYTICPNGKLDSIGLDGDLKQNQQTILTSDRFLISKEIAVFSNVVLTEPRPKSNSGLLTEHKGQTVDDTFVYEQNLVIEEDGKTLLVTGCAHSGIVNILEHFHRLRGRMPNYVIGGFHLSSRSGGNEDFETIDRIGKYLVGTEARFYTCHCTDIEPDKRLKTTMGDSIDYLSAGTQSQAKNKGVEL